MANTETSTGQAVVLGDPGAELRTFLFADIRGYTRFTQEHGDQAAATLVAKFAQLIGSVARARGGRLVELRGDEAFAVFGSARQALRAAVDMQRRFAEETTADPLLPLPVGIGLDAGEAVTVDSGYRGEVLNLAARLCNLAVAGEILASEGVVYLGRRVQGLSFAERGLVPLKGFAEPVHVIRVLGEGETVPAGDSIPTHVASRTESTLPIGGFLGALPTGVMVGRDREWAQIMDSLESVYHGSGRLVMLSGEPGIGKTRLAQEVTLKVRHWNFTVATGRCYQQEMTVPFYPFIEALTTMYRQSPEWLQAEAPARWPHLQRLLPDVIEPLVEPAPEAREDQQRLFRAVTGFLQTLAETAPVALLLDDLHWADDSTLKLLQHLARYTRGSRILLLGTYRDVEVNRQHPLETFLMDLGREALVSEVEVRRLDPAGTADLLSEILGAKDDLTELAQLVHRRTEGNAFFIHEMIRALVERGDVYRRDGRWESRTDLELDVPKSIRSVIGQRLSRLPSDVQEILREASVLGQAFQFDDLLALSNYDDVQLHRGDGDNRKHWTEDEVDAGLQEAAAAGLVRETGSDGYAFDHALIQQALYAELSTRRKKRIHLAAGTVLARLPERARTKRTAELAWHYLEGDDPQQALPYAMLAGDQAEEVFAHGEAEGHYRTALELALEVGDVPKQGEALEKLASVLSLVARYDEALDSLERAATVYRSVGNTDAEASAAAQIGHIHFVRGSRIEGIARLHPLIERLEKDQQGTRPTYGLAALYAALARLHTEAYHGRQKLEMAERASALADEVGDDHLFIGAEVTRGDALWRVGKEEEAIRVLEQIIPRAEAASDLSNLTRALGNAAGYHARRGEFAKDRIYHERMLDIAERRGDRGYIVLAAMSLSANAFLVGDWGRSREYLDRSETIIRSLGVWRLSLWPMAARGWLALRQGDLDSAAEAATRTIEVAERLGDDDYRRLAERLLAVRQMMMGETEAALGRLEPFLAEPHTASDYGLLRDLGWAYLTLDCIEQALDLAQRAIALAMAEKDPPELIDSLVLKGSALTRANEWDDARQSLEQALEAARALPYPYGEAQVLVHHGRLLVQQGDRPRGIQYLREALVIFERLGAQWDADRVRTLL
ncbi:MAG: AAA family ATPase [Chloroflexota bacterium]